MAGQILRFNKKICQPSSPIFQQVATIVHRSRIGNREVVGHGVNGEYSYIDSLTVPLPAIRFKAMTPELQALREKEKGDWKQLSIEEKKQLYRASFCQTFAEMRAPTGEWKSILGMTLLGVSISFWFYIFVKTFVYSEYPESFSDERRKGQLERIIALRPDPFDGLTSKWDYENNRWKK